MATETTTTLEIQQIRRLRKSCLKTPSPVPSRSNSSERCPTTTTTTLSSSRSPTPMAMANRDDVMCTAATKRVSFDDSECIVFTADDWDRTPTEPARKLSYQDLLELKEIQKSLPRAIQPHDPRSTRDKRYLTSVPIELLPLLPSNAPAGPEPSTTPNSSPVSSPSSSGASTPLDTETPQTTAAEAPKPAVTYTAPSSLFPHGIRIQRTAPPPPPHQAGGPRPCFRPSPSLFRPRAPAIVNHPTIRSPTSPRTPSPASPSSPSAKSSSSSAPPTASPPASPSPAPPAPTSSPLAAPARSGFAPPGGFGFAPSSNSKPTSPPARKRPNFTFMALMESPAESPATSRVTTPGSTTPSKEQEEKGFAEALQERLGEQESRMRRREAMEESEKRVKEAEAEEESLAQAENQVDASQANGFPLESKQLDASQVRRALESRKSSAVDASQAQARSDVSGDSTVELGTGEGVGASSKSDIGLPDLAKGEMKVDGFPDRDSSAAASDSLTTKPASFGKGNLCTSPASSSSSLPHLHLATSSTSTSTSPSDADPPTPSLTNASLDSSPSPSPSPYTLDLHDLGYSSSNDHGYSSAGYSSTTDHGYSSAGSEYEHDGSSYYSSSEIDASSTYGDDDMSVDLHPRIMGSDGEGVEGHHHHYGPLDMGYMGERWGTTPKPKSSGRENFWARQSPGRWTPPVPAPSTPKPKAKRKKQVIVINDIEIELDDDDYEEDDEGNVEDDESSVKGVSTGSGSGRATPTSGTPGRFCTVLPLSDSTMSLRGVGVDESPSTPTHAGRETCGGSEGSPPTPTGRWGGQAV